MSEQAELRAAALRLLMRREHSRHQLAAKLAQRGHDAAQIEQELDALERERLLSDERFAEAYARSRSERGYGPQRIAAELGERGVNDGLVRETLDAVETDWFVLARAQRHRRFGAAIPADAKERARQQRFLYYRGFSAEHIRYALEQGDD